ncbi:MAG: hypothetical protein NC078_09075 [Ruminococcus sp.]|nr:hypothetical protein [Ruminococcus sp.]
MKKYSFPLRLLPLMTAAVICSGCGASGEETDISDKSDGSNVSETSAEEQTSEVAAKPLTPIGETSPYAGGEVNVNEDEESEDWAAKVLTPHETSPETTEETSPETIAEITEPLPFDDISLLSFAALDSEDPDPAALEAAIAAYRQSEYYREALERAKEMVYYEDGEFFAAEEENWLAGASVNYVYLNDEGEMDIQAHSVYSRRAKFDGENEETLILLQVLLPDCLFEWSGNASAHIPVYVNSKGEAVILSGICSQDYEDCFVLSYENGKSHAVFNFGHNMGGMKTAVYSFENGEPICELAFWGHTELHEDMNVISVYNAAYMHTLFFYDPESGRYSGLKKVRPTAEQAAALSESGIVSERISDPYQLYKEGRLVVTGGKYFTFLCDNGYTYKFDGENFEESDMTVYDGYYHKDTESSLFENDEREFDLYNIKL